MTPEQRKTWKEHQDRLYAMAVDDGETWDLSANDQAACNAGGDAIMALLDRAALAPAPTCGTCRWLHFHDVQKNIGYCSRWHDAASGAYAVVYPIVAVSDRPAHYCAAHEPTEPTEPTR